MMLGGIFGRLVAAMLPQNCIEYLAPDGDFGQYIARLEFVVSIERQNKHAVELDTNLRCPKHQSANMSDELRSAYVEKWKESRNDKRKKGRTKERPKGL